MKKLLIVLLIAMAVPAMALDFSGRIDLDYFMVTPADSDDDPVDDWEIAESFFGEVSSILTLKQDLADNITGCLKLQVAETSNGIDTTSALGVEELWVKGADAFGQAGLGFKFGKMEVPANLDYDTGISHTFTNGVALWSVGLGEIDRTWGFTGSYALEGVGTFSLTTFEAIGGVDMVDEEDEDTGLFNSIALQWDTGADAFGVTGLRLVVAYVMTAGYLDMDGGSVISLGATYEVMEGLTVALEIDMTKNVCMDYVYVSSGGAMSMIDAAAETVFMDADGGMLIAVNADYKINEQFAVGLSYEMLTYQDVTDGGAGGTEDLAVGTDSRIALRGSYIVAENNAIRLEYSMVANNGDDTDDVDLDGDGDDDSLGYSQIAIGYDCTF